MNRDFIKIIDGAKAGDNSAFEDTGGTIVGASTSAVKGGVLATAGGKIAVKAYSYVPSVFNREILPTAYQDKKIEFNDLPNEVKLINVFRNIKFIKVQ